MTRRSLQLFLAGLCLVALSTTSANAQQKSYPPDVVRAYIENCTAGRGAAVRAICTCTIRKIQAKYRYEEFRKINADIAAGKPLPPELLDISRKCQANPNA